MTNPTEQFRESVEWALERLIDDGTESNTGFLNPAEALASIQASTVELLEKLPAQIATEVGGRKPIPHGVFKVFDQLIKDLSK